MGARASSAAGEGVRRVGGRARGRAVCLHAAKAMVGCGGGGASCSLSRTCVGGQRGPSEGCMRAATCSTAVQPGRSWRAGISSAAGAYPQAASAHQVIEHGQPPRLVVVVDCMRGGWRPGAGFGWGRGLSSRVRPPAPAPAVSGAAAARSRPCRPLPAHAPGWQTEPGDRRHGACQWLHGEGGVRRLRQPPPFPERMQRAPAGHRPMPRLLGSPARQGRSPARWQRPARAQTAAARACWQDDARGWACSVNWAGGSKQGPAAPGFGPPPPRAALAARRALHAALQGHACLPSSDTSTGLLRRGCGCLQLTERTG